MSDAPSGGLAALKSRFESGNVSNSPKEKEQPKEAPAKISDLTKKFQEPAKSSSPSSAKPVAGKIGDLTKNFEAPGAKNAAFKKPMAKKFGAAKPASSVPPGQQNFHKPAASASKPAPAKSWKKPAASPQAQGSTTKPPITTGAAGTSSLLKKFEAASAAAAPQPTPKPKVTTAASKPVQSTQPAPAVKTTPGKLAISSAFTVDDNKAAPISPKGKPSPNTTAKPSASKPAAQSTSGAAKSAGNPKPPATSEAAPAKLSDLKARFQQPSQDQPKEKPAVEVPKRNMSEFAKKFENTETSSEKPAPARTPGKISTKKFEEPEPYTKPTPVEEDNTSARDEPAPEEHNTSLYEQEAPQQEEQEPENANEQPEYEREHSNEQEERERIHEQEEHEQSNYDEPAAEPEARYEDEQGGGNEELQSNHQQHEDKHHSENHGDEADHAYEGEAEQTSQEEPAATADPTEATGEPYYPIERLFAAGEVTDEEFTAVDNGLSVLAPDADDFDFSILGENVSFKLVVPATSQDTLEEALQPYIEGYKVAAYRFYERWLAIVWQYE